MTHHRSQGYSKTGSVRNSTLNTLDLPVSAVQMRPFKVLEARSTDIILSVECLKTGQTACATDEDGNTGAGNQGRNNIGEYDVGDWTISEQIGSGRVTQDLSCDQLWRQELIDNPQGLPPEAIS